MALAASIGAQSLAGVVVDPAGIPVAGVTIIFSNGGGSAVSNATGNFLVSGLSNRTYNTVDFQSPLATVASLQRTNVVVSGATNLGNVTLPFGARITGNVLSPTGAGAVGGNMNAYDQAGHKLFTPNDAIGPGGAFSVTVPVGYNRLRAVPVVGAPLIPFDWVLTDVTGPMNLGTVTMTVGYSVTGSTVDVVNSLPIGLVEVQVKNAQTGEYIPQLQPNTTVFGAFSLLLPPGIFDFEFYPPNGNAHAPKQAFGVIVTPGPMSIGQVRMQRAVFVSGTVVGPAGPVFGADIDVFTLDGEKLWTPNGDDTDATGLFVVPVPAGTYIFTAEPPVASGLVGVHTGPITVTISSSIGSLNVQPGFTLAGRVLGPNGPEAGADIDVVDPLTGEVLVTLGDDTTATGDYAVVIPAGTWQLRVDAAQGSIAAPTVIDNFTIAASTVQDFTLGTKSLVTNLSTVSTYTQFQGSYMPAMAFVNNLTTGFLPTLIELAVQYPSGAETPIFPPIPIDVAPQFPLTLGPVWLPLPPIPASELGRPLKYVLRFRSPITNLVLDQASVVFYVQ